MQIFIISAFIYTSQIRLMEKTKVAKGERLRVCD